MTRGKNLKNKPTNGTWLGLFVIAISILPGLALADSGVGPEATKIIVGIAAAWIVALGVSIKKPREGIMLTAGMAILASLYLGNQHFVDGPALCDAGDLFSCSTVSSSEYSALFGVPIAFLGTGYYVAMLLLGYFSNTEEYKSVPQLLTLGGIFSILYSAVLAYFSAVKIKAWCLFCIALYGFNAIALLGAVLLANKQKEKVALLAGKAFGNGVTVFVVTVIVCMAIFSESTDQIKQKTARLSIADITVELAEPISFDGSEPRLGSPKAKIQLVEFADFKCGHCAKAAPTLKKIVEAHPDVNLRFKQYPLSNKCNPNIDSIGMDSCQIAVATECAHKQKKFWEFSRLVFKNQDYLSRPGILTSFAEQVGLDKNVFNTCLEDPQLEAGITSDVRAATKAGVTGTPSIYLTGVGEEGKWYKLDGHVEDLLIVLNKMKNSEQ